MEWLLVVTIILLSLTTMSTTLKPTYFVNAKFYCVNDVVYYTHTFLREGKVTLRMPKVDLHTVSQLQRVQVLLSDYSLLTVQLSNSSSPTLEFAYGGGPLLSSSNGTLHTQLFNIAASLESRKDLYLKKTMTFLHINFAQMERNLTFREIAMNNISVVPQESHYCTNYSFEDVMYYHYFQRAFSISSVAVASFLVLMTVVTLLQQIVLSRHLLVKSRLLSEIPSNILIGISDAIIIVCYSIDIYFIDRRDMRNTTLLLIVAYIRSFAAYSAAVCFVLNNIRYIYLINYYRTMREGRKVSKIQRIFLSKLVFVVALLLFSSIMLVIIVIIGVVVGPTNSLIGSILASSITTIACVIALIVCVAVIVTDFVLNRSTIKKFGLFAFFKRDPLYLRIQTYLVFATLVVGAPYGVINALLVPNYGSITLTYIRVVFYIVLYVFTGLFLRLLMCGTFVCMVQTGKLLLGRKKVETISTIKFEKLMSNKECQDMFVEYCKHEFSLENIMFYMHMQSFKDKEFTAEDFRFICDEFVRPYSPVQVNLSSSTVKKLLQLESALEDGGRVKFQEIYEIAHVDLLSNLSDTTSRFVLTEEYKKWEESTSNIGELVETAFAL